MAASLRTAKQQLRESIREALKNMTVQERVDQSSRLVKKLLDSKVYQDAQKISIYLSMPLEVDTTAITEDIFKNNKSCYVPRFKDDHMDMLRVYSIEDIASLPVYKWGIRQPSFEDNKRENALEHDGLDLIIMPGLGFTQEGQRLGQGKGYYDKYLHQYATTFGQRPPTIALAFDVQKCSQVPTGPNDVPIDYVLFP